MSTTVGIPCIHCGKHVVEDWKPAPHLPSIWTHYETNTTLCHPVVTFAEPPATSR